MKCDQAKLLFMDYLYDEITDMDLKALQRHLDECNQCQHEYQALKQTSDTLQQSEDVEPRMNFVFVREHESIWQRVRRHLLPQPRRWGLAFALGLAGVLLVCALFNTEIHYWDGDFSLRMSIWPQQRADGLYSAQEVQAMLTRLRDENIQLTQRLIQQSEHRQQQQLASSLIQLSREFEAKRASDLQLLGAGLGEVEQSIYHRVERKTSNQLNDLMRYISAQQPRR